LRRVVHFKAVVLEVPEEVSCTYSVGARWIIMASLLRGSRCRRCLLPGVIVDLVVALHLGSSGDLLLLELLIFFSILRWYIRSDNQDLAIKSLELLSQIVR
jgi:hypothetical protein